MRPTVNSHAEAKGYRLSYRLAQDILRLGTIVIADSVNPEDFTRKEWNAVATDVGADFINIEVLCSDKNEHTSRVESRGPSISGAKLPTWGDVLNRNYHAWTEGRVALDTAGKTPDESFDELMAAIKSRLSL